MHKFIQYLKDSRSELKKVAWPSKEETTKHTLIVIGVSLFMAIFLGAVDYLLNVILQLVI